MPYTQDVEMQLACLGEHRHALFCKAVDDANKRIALKNAAKSESDNQYDNACDSCCDIDWWCHMQ